MRLPAMKLLTLWMTGTIGCGILPSYAAIPLFVNHQGVLEVNGAPFDGNADFRFAFIDTPTGNNIWTNDGSGLGVFATPTGAVNLPVVNGIYVVRLGDTAIPGMTALPSDTFDADSVALRVWVDDGINGTIRLSPDQELASAPYAVHALVADFAVNATQANNADTLDGVHAAALEESAEIVAAVAAHNASPGAHANIEMDGSRITTGTVGDSRVASTLARDGEVFGIVTSNDGSGSGLDADTVDGAHAGALEESAEIDSDVAAHNADSAAHANLQINASNITSGTLDPAFLSPMMFPRRATLWHIESTAEVGGSIDTTCFADEDHFTTCYSRQSSSSDGDTFTNSFFIREGTYEFAVLGVEGNDHGKLDWYVDDVLVVSGQDWYDGSNVFGQWKTASVFVAGNGHHVLKGLVNGKRGSSSDYVIKLTMMYFRPESD